MKTETINLEQDVIRLTSKFSELLVRSMTALNLGTLTTEVITIVEENKDLGEVYKKALEKLLIALEEEPLADERVHRIEFATRMETLRQREMRILLQHPTYAKNRE